MRVTCMLIVAPAIGPGHVLGETAIRTRRTTSAANRDVHAGWIRQMGWRRALGVGAVDDRASDGWQVSRP